MPVDALLLLLNLAVLPLVGILSFIIRRLYMKVENIVPRSEIRILIDDKMAPLDVGLRMIDKRLDIIEKEQRLILIELRKYNGSYH